MKSASNDQELQLRRCLNEKIRKGGAMLHSVKDTDADFVLCCRTPLGPSRPILEAICACRTQPFDVVVVVAA